MLKLSKTRNPYAFKNIFLAYLYIIFIKLSMIPSFIISYCLQSPSENTFIYAGRKYLFVITVNHWEIIKYRIEWSYLCWWDANSTSCGTGVFKPILDDLVADFIYGVKKIFEALSPSWHVILTSYFSHAWSVNSYLARVHADQSAHISKCVKYCTEHYITLHFI